MLTLEQKATNFDTMKHIDAVRNLLISISQQLIQRGMEHDKCKMEDPEVSIFVEFTPKLSTTNYGSEDYKKFLEQMKPALDHHYANSRHHTEHFKNGINDMNLVDLIEMFVDWKAATMRQQNGNLRKSIEINANKYGISPQLVKIFENSIELFDK